jgi:protoheme IX farnesyltransferase
MRFLYHCWQMWRNKDTGIKTFRFSIIYLMVLFAIMLLDHYLIEKIINPMQF